MVYKPKFEPILKAAAKPAEKAEDRAAVLFLHGFDDDGPGCENIATQLSTSPHFNLGHTVWLVPTASVNLDARTTAWYLPTALPATAPSRPELADDEDEAGMLVSLAYLESLLDAVPAEHGIAPARIVVAGFSQGGAMAQLLGLVSRRYAGRVAAVVALMSYLPLGAARIREIRDERGIGGGEGAETLGTVPVLVVRGARDRLIPRRVFNLMLEGVAELYGERAKEMVTVREYDGVGHNLSPAVLMDLAAFLESVVPGPEAKEAKGQTSGN